MTELKNNTHQSSGHQGFTAFHSYSLSLNLQKDKSCPYFSQPYREGFPRPNQGYLETFSVSTSVLHKLSTSAHLQRDKYAVLYAYG